MVVPIEAEQPIVQLKVDHISTFSLAAQQNAYPLFRKISVHYPALNSGVQPSLKNLIVKLSSDPEIFFPEEWVVDEIRPGQGIALPKRPLTVPHGFLFSLTEELKVSITFLIISDIADKPRVGITTENFLVEVL